MFICPIFFINWWFGGTKHNGKKTKQIWFCGAKICAGKQRRLKQAKEEAQEEIEKYRLERDRQFKEFEAKVCSYHEIVVMIIIILLIVYVVFFHFRFCSAAYGLKGKRCC